MTPIPAQTAGRRGTTLTEVLMALLVMGLGVVSVATLFPLSVMRSAEATRLTSATLLRQNAETRLRFSQSRRTDNTTTPPTVVVVADRWAILNDPDGDGDLAEHDNEPRAVFDPLGIAVLTEQGIANARLFGDFNRDGDITTADDGNPDFNSDGNSDPPIGRYGFTIPANVEDAAKFVSLPDSFVDVADVIVRNSGDVATTSVQLRGHDFGEFAVTPPAKPSLRVTVFHVDGRRSVTRAVDSVSGETLTLAAADALPSDFPGNVGRVLVESAERRYSWLATVRRFGNKPQVTVAVFFRRAFDMRPIGDEAVFDLTRTANNTFEIRNAPDPLPPGLRKGGYMLDLSAFRWVQIGDVSVSGTTVTIKADSSERDVYRDKTPPPTLKAVFPRNVVEVYPLKLEN